MKVVTAVVNNPQFIELQYYTLARYMKCEYEFIVFNDAKSWADFSNGGDPTMRAQIEAKCVELGVKCINIPNESHEKVTSAATRCADANNFILNYQLANPDMYLCIDSDMFLIADFDGSQYADKSAAILLQSRGDTHYFWNGIYYFDVPKMAHTALLNWNELPHTDVGGSMVQWLQLTTGGSLPSTDDLRWKPSIYKTDSLYFIRHLWSLTWDASELPTRFNDRVNLREFLAADPRNQDGKYFAEIYDDCFLHYRAGGNWRGEGMDLHISLTSRLMGALLGDF